MTDIETQASRLIHQYGRDGALKAVEKNIKKSVSDAQEEFWEAVAELIEETCKRQSENPMKIVVNGNLVEFEPAYISYEEIVALAGLTGTPSVTYRSKRDGDVRREGTMYTGCSPVLLTDVMTFSVVHTGGA